MDNVCILTTVHPPFDTRIFHKQAKTLVRAGYDVTLIAQHDGNTVVEGIRVIGLPKPRNRFTRIFGLTWRAFRLALRQHADVYHFHDPELLLVGTLLKLFTRAKVVYDVHENVPKQILNKEWLPRWGRRILVALYRAVEWSCLRFMDSIVLAEDSYTANYYQHRNVTIIHNYPVISAFGREPRAAATSDGGTLVYVGGVSRLRGALELVNALRILIERGVDASLHLVGPVAPSNFAEEIHSLVHAYGLDGRVRVPGAVPYEEVPEFLATARVGLAVLHPDPNYEESLPTKLLEYMAAGLPVVASNFPLWREIVEGNHCGICVDPLNPKEIAQATEYLITHPEEARRMGENGRRAVEEMYNWEREATKLLGLYRKLLSQ
ncbi:MAG: glycosyltransferase family 1 protein [Deltaproteobacteria bacterium]|nr:MAG: glycosyltransferase family 1 protein [Deltaproteobacteria bacterium]